MTEASPFLPFLNHKPPTFIAFTVLLTLSSFFVFQEAFCQQTYAGGPADAATSAPSSAGVCSRDVDLSPGYTNNGIFRACSSFFTFRAADPYRTVVSISRLFQTNPSSFANIGNQNLTESTVLESNQLVVIRANCTSRGSSPYYQMTVPSYVGQSGDSVYSIANQIYQGLTTCQAIFDHNPTLVNDPEGTPGTEMEVPLRCACPTFSQSEAGIKSLLTYIVAAGDTVADISARFDVEPGLTFKANELSKHDNDKIYPFTTLLVPVRKNLPSTPAGLQPPPPPRHDQSITQSASTAKKSRKNGGLHRDLFILLGIAGGIVGLGITITIQYTCIQVRT